MIKVVTFDLDGVFFINAQKNIIAQFAQRYNLDEDVLKEVLFVRAAAEGGYNDLKKGEIPADQYWNWLFATLGLTGRVTKEDYLETLIAGYEINQEAVALIAKLHKQGIKTAICSNNYRDNIELLEKKYQLGKYFDVQVYSYDVGYLKPAEEIFQALVDKSGVKPEEIAYADDKEEKLSGALQLGIKAFVYENFARFQEKLKELGVKI